MEQLLIRCSGISKIIGRSDTALSDTAKSHIREIAKENLFGYRSFQGSKYTEKGITLEEQAIKLSGLVRGRIFKKNEERKENGFITGECDVFDSYNKIIIDEKCSWDIGTHPFFSDEAEKKVKKSGYDWQMQGYMWLWDCEQAEVDFCLFPTPEDLLSTFDNPTKYIDLVNDIPQRQRIKTVIVKRDEKKIEQIKKMVLLAREYYNDLIKQYGY